MIPLKICFTHDFLISIAVYRFQDEIVDYLKSQRRLSARFPSWKTEETCLFWRSIHCTSCRHVLNLSTPVPRESLSWNRGSLSTPLFDLARPPAHWLVTQSFVTSHWVNIYILDFQLKSNFCYKLFAARSSRTATITFDTSGEIYVLVSYIWFSNSKFFEWNFIMNFIAYSAYSSLKI